MGRFVETTWLAWLLGYGPKQTCKFCDGRGCERGRMFVYACQACEGNGWYRLPKRMEVSS